MTDNSEKLEQLITDKVESILQAWKPRLEQGIQQVLNTDIPTILENQYNLKPTNQLGETDTYNTSNLNGSSGDDAPTPTTSSYTPNPEDVLSSKVEELQNQLNTQIANNYWQQLELAAQSKGLYPDIVKALVESKVVLDPSNIGNQLAQLPELIDELAKDSRLLVKSEVTSTNPEIPPVKSNRSNDVANLIGSLFTNPNL